MLDALAHDTNLWMVASFVIFLYILVKAAKSALSSVVDTRIEKIKRELQESENLHTEAQELLAQYKRKHANALKEAKEIINNAELYATKIRKQAKKDLKENMTRREEQLQERIDLLKDNALLDIQRHAADIAIDVTREILLKNLDKKTDKTLIEETLVDIKKQA